MRILLIPLIVFSLLSPASGQTPELQGELKAFQKQFSFPGATLAYVTEEGKENALAVGYSDREEKVELTVKHKLLAGSIGKTYVAAVALQLVGEKKLDLDAKISKYLGEETWFPRLANHKEITVRMLMNHTSGIKEHVYNQDFGKAVAENPDKTFTTKEIIEFALDTPALFEAGTRWAYADTNYIVLGMVIEKVTDNTFYAELDKRVLKPFKLKDTVPSNSRVIPGLAAGYAGPKTPFLKQGKTILKNKLVINPQVEWTGGGLATTTLDLARWSKLLFEGKGFPKELNPQFFNGKPAYTGRGDKYGLGVMIWKSKHGICYGHSGWFPGYLSIMAFYKELNLAMALQINSDEDQRVYLNMRRFLDGCADLIKKNNAANSGN